MPMDGLVPNETGKDCVVKLAVQTDPVIRGSHRRLCIHRAQASAVRLLMSIGPDARFQIRTTGTVSRANCD
jgi:hypothetical protein